ncbi:MAG: hypothetical protein WD276_00275 [Actinomycetota bacterium]
MTYGTRFVLAASLVAAAVCAATGVYYLVAPELSKPPPVGIWLGTLALLGASALVAGGFVQQRAAGLVRVIVLAAVAVVAAAYVAANALAFVAAGGGLPGVPRPLHAAGLAAGWGLFLVALAEGSLAAIHERRAD